MATSGNKPLEKKKGISNAKTMHCLYCNDELDIDEFYDSNSELHKATYKMPYCKKCIDVIYKKYVEKYTEKRYADADRRAIERICMVLDLYYSDKLFDSVIDDMQKKMEKVTDPDAKSELKLSFVPLFFKKSNLYQYKIKCYDDTINDNRKHVSGNEDIGEDIAHLSDEDKERVDKAVRLFGKGFVSEDYLFLYDQYNDWTARNECKTKTQEEIFKRLCFTQLELHKATLARQNTKDLDVTFQRLLDMAKLQPKQNDGDIISDTQTFGTLINKWENTRPLPEIDEELKDVDKIGLYIDVFFRGHLAKMMGLKNGLSNLYTNYIKKYTVNKPEYYDDEDSEVIFDAIFGGSPESDGGDS